MLYAWLIFKYFDCKKNGPYLNGLLFLGINGDD